MMTASLENAIGAAGGFSCGREWLIETQVPQIFHYHKVPKFSDARNFAVIHLKFKQRGQT